MRLSPAYDLVCTRLAIPDDQLALPISGKRDRLRRHSFLELAAHMRLPARAAERVLADVARRLEGAVALVERSSLPADAQVDYVSLLRIRAATLLAE